MALNRYISAPFLNQILHENLTERPHIGRLFTYNIKTKNGILVVKRRLTTRSCNTAGTPTCSTVQAGQVRHETGYVR